ncbi:DUF2642 domain-containing protein [Paenibacillus sp. NPDC056579]|uniref:DUF2642 domain-containing protein n=1 Tax=Paenibacillus sp. NPDC056579 TaxID=3345871 RepID=UPI0036AD547C
MAALTDLLGQNVILTISGINAPLRGNLDHLGNDMIILNNGRKYIYIPLLHLRQLVLDDDQRTGDNGVMLTEPLFDDEQDISYRKMLMNAKGVFTEMVITGSQPLHGYVTSVMNDFFAFYSPVYQVVYIPMQQLKYMIPYEPNVTPYALMLERFPLSPLSLTLARTFDQQMKKLEGRLVVLDSGDDPHTIGQLKSIRNGMVELVAAGGETVFLHMEQIRTVHIP